MSCKLQGRLKSLYSIHKKMQRKNVGLAEIYDARALRVVIDDGGDRQNEEAIIACYQVRTQRMQCCCRRSKSQQRSVALHLLTPASDVCADMFPEAVLQVQSAATRLWKRIAGEQDDYIANPKVTCLHPGPTTRSTCATPLSRSLLMVIGSFWAGAA